MAPLSKSKSPHASLSATYSSPTDTHDFVHPIATPLPPASSASVKDTTAYLSELRSSTKKLQEEINVFLTQRMEDAKAAAEGVPHAGKKTKDELEEENYGEEVVEDEEDG